MDSYRSFQHARKNGFGMNLYRNIKNKKVGGVCAGLADHFDIDANIMRVLVFGGFVFTGMLAIWGYLIAWVVLSPKTSKVDNTEYQYDEEAHCYKKKNMFRYRRSAKDRLKTATDRLNSLLRRVENVEHYVTSKQYDLNKKFADLEK